MNEEEKKETMLGSPLRDAIARSIVSCLPNIKWKELSKLVAEFEVELENLYTLSQEEE